MKHSTSSVVHDGNEFGSVVIYAFAKGVSTTLRKTVASFHLFTEMKESGTELTAAQEEELAQATNAQIDFLTSKGGNRTPAEAEQLQAA